MIKAHFPQSQVMCSSELCTSVTIHVQLPFVPVCWVLCFVLTVDNSKFYVYCLRSSLLCH
jgi:hypothetical protein